MPRTCKVCKKKFEPQYNSVQMTCSYGCAIKYAKTERKKNEKALNELREQKKSKNSLQALKTHLRITCHNYIRLRDKGKPCISCGTKWKDNHQAGHFYKASDYSNLKYEENNIFGQCERCNLFLDGNNQEYRLRITERITETELLELDEKAREYKKTSFKWDRHELNKKLKYYQDKLKQLKK